MSENEPKALSLAEFVKQKKQMYHDEAVRCKTYAETSKGSVSTISAESFWNWMESIHLEFEHVYTIVDRLLNSDRYAVNISKQILGLSEIASPEEINARTKEFGELVSILVRKKEEWEQEEKQKERLK